MRKSLFSLFMFISAVGYAFPGIPDGIYVGTGRMKTASGLDSAYTAKLTLRGPAMEAFYDYGGGKIITYVATIESKSALEFRILEDKKEIGTGYCDSSLCHLDVPGHQAEESWFVDGAKLTRVGSMAHGPVKLVYTETLSLQSAIPSNEEKLVLECEGFEQSDTKMVRVFRTSDSEGSLVEINMNDKEVKRIVTKEELGKMAFKISPIFGMDRVINFKGGEWVLSYSCGEDRPLQCKTTRRE